MVPRLPLHGQVDVRLDLLEMFHGDHGANLRWLHRLELTYSHGGYCPDKSSA